MPNGYVAVLRLENTKELRVRESEYVSVCSRNEKWLRGPTGACSVEETLASGKDVDGAGVEARSHKATLSSLIRLSVAGRLSVVAQMAGATSLEAHDDAASAEFILCESKRKSKLFCESAVLELQRRQAQTLTTECPAADTLCLDLSDSADAIDLRELKLPPIWLHNCQDRVFYACMPTINALITVESALSRLQLAGIDITTHFLSTPELAGNFVFMGAPWEVPHNTKFRKWPMFKSTKYSGFYPHEGVSRIGVIWK